MLRVRNRFFLLIAILVADLLVLSALYMLGMDMLEGKPRTFWQALQFAAGTTSTTGFGPDTAWTHPAMVLLVVAAQFIGVFLIFMVFPIVLIPMLEERFETKLPNESTHERDHVVIFDSGPAVATLINELEQAKIPTVVIDEDEAEARHSLAQGHHVIHGSLEEGVLVKSNLLQARAFIVNGSDDRNAAAILTARQLGYQGEILALVEDPFHRRPMILAGASGAFTPRHVLGAALAARASEKVSPTVAGVQHLGDQLQITEVRIARDSVLVGKPLKEAGSHAGVVVIGQWTAGKLIADPAPDMRLEAGGILLLAGSDQGIQTFVAQCAGTHRLNRDGRFVIAGGGEVGRKVVQLLQDCGEKTFMIDAHAGPGVDLVGNVLDVQVLQQAGIEQAQAVIMALSADAPALFATVIIKDMAPNVPVIARVNSAENVDRLYGAGADFVQSISQVSGQLLAMNLLGRESVSVDMQLQVAKVSAQGLEQHHPRKDHLREQTGCSVVAVERGAELVVEFADEFAIRAGDAVYICGSAAAVQRFNQRYPKR